MAMTACEGDLLAPAGTMHHDTPQPAAPEGSPAARADTLRQRAERAWYETLALLARSQTLIQVRPEVSRQELLTVSPLARLRAQLATMPVIEQAKGILIFQQGCDPDEAFALLRRASQRSNLPIRVLAEQIVSRAQQHSRQRQEKLTRGHQPERHVRDQ
jgi:hypothetical protein